jgi:hypothetical protein
LKSVDSEEELTEEEQMRMIEDQFKSLYEYDADVRKLIPMEEVKKMTLEDKYHVITAYMRGGGIRGLIGEDEDDVGDLSPEEQRMVEEEFLKLYHEEPRFRMIIGDTKPSVIPLRDKYELILAFSKRGSSAPLSDTDSDTPKVEGEFVTYRGKKYKRVRIDNDEPPNEDEDEEYLMDEQGNIYDTKFRLIGRADDDEEEDHNYEEMMKMMDKGADESNDFLEDFDMAKFEKDLSKRLDDKKKKPFGLEDDDYQDDFDDDEFNL